MSQDRLSDATLPFSVGDTEFRCWIVGGGQQYEWRSTCGRLRAGRNRGSSTCWASCDGPLVRADYDNLRGAMIAATLARRRAAA